MTREGKQALVAVVLAVLISTVLIAVAWVSMADLALVGITALVCFSIGWGLGYRYGIEQRQQIQRTRRRRGTSRGPARRKL